MPTPTTIVVTPSAVTVPAAGTQQFAAVVKDQSGDPINGLTVFWMDVDAGEITQSGLYTADPNVTSGQFPVTASCGPLSGSATITLAVTQVPTTVSVTPASAPVLAGGAQVYAAAVADQFGNPITGLTVTWASEDGASIDADGLLTTQATGNFNLTASVGGVTGHATADVVPPVTAADAAHILAGYTVGGVAGTASGTAGTAPPGQALGLLQVAQAGAVVTFQQRADATGQPCSPPPFTVTAIGTTAEANFLVGCRYLCYVGPSAVRLLFVAPERASFDVAGAAAAYRP